MVQIARTVLAVLLAALVGAVVAAPADAAKRKVPPGFFGTVFDTSIILALSDAQLDREFGRMAANGVESTRVVFNWDRAQPGPGQFNWAPTDRLARSAAAHGIDLLPIVIYTPRWASSVPGAGDYYTRPPADYGTYGTFMRALVQRYGRGGEFWRLNPGRDRAIRRWQIWNEPAADFNWNVPNWGETYPRLLREGYRAVKSLDRGAKVVLGSLVGLSGANKDPWTEIDLFYKNGARGYFDIVAVHPFSNFEGSVRDSVDRVLRVVQLVRAEMRQRGRREARKPIWFTELSWSAAKGRIPRSELLGLETTAAGQARRLTAMYQRLARTQRRYRVTRAFWYSWSTAYVPQSIEFNEPSFQYVGLNRVSGTTITPVALLRTYANVAARLSGCRKTTRGTCRR